MNVDKKADTPERRPMVMIVDDEAMVTQSLRALLELETDYGVLDFQSPGKALEALNESPVDVVISDFLMPEMNGLQFLAAARKLYPEVPRIILTGYADKENAIKAINEVDIFQYVEKPWENDQLKLVIQNAVSSKSLRETLRARIHDLDRALLERDKLLERDARIRRELEMARQLQESLLPKDIPALDGVSLAAAYHPAHEVGGDLYDMIPLSDDRYAVIVADVTGHGVQAAFSTATLKFAFSQFHERNMSPAEILHEMNGVLCGGLPKDIFAAACVLTIDAKSRLCVFANAGNPHPALLRRSSGDVTRIIANGMPLGVVGSDTYHVDGEETFDLESGDTVVLFTDGISEVENESGETFDGAAMKRVLLERPVRPAADLVAALVSAGREFSRKNHEWDDVTIIAIDVK